MKKIPAQLKRQLISMTADLIGELLEDVNTQVSQELYGQILAHDEDGWDDDDAFDLVIEIQAEAWKRYVKKTWGWK
jgi:hypothetical protein